MERRNFLKYVISIVTASSFVNSVQGAGGEVPLLKYVRPNDQWNEFHLNNFLDHVYSRTRQRLILQSLEFTSEQPYDVEEIKQKMVKTCANTDNMFLARTKPP